MEILEHSVISQFVCNCLSLSFSVILLKVHCHHSYNRGIRHWWPRTLAEHNPRDDWSQAAPGKGSMRSWPRCISDHALDLAVAVHPNPTVLLVQPQQPHPRTRSAGTTLNLAKLPRSARTFVAGETPSDSCWPKSQSPFLRKWQTRFLVDTGSEVSAIPPSPPDCRHSPDKLTLMAMNDTPIRTYGKRSLTLNLGLRRSFPWIFIIAEVQKPILGADFLWHFGLLVDMKQHAPTGWWSYSPIYPRCSLFWLFS